MPVLQALTLASEVANPEARMVVQLHSVPSASGAEAVREAAAIDPAVLVPSLVVIAAEQLLLALMVASASVNGRATQIDAACSPSYAEPATQSIALGFEVPQQASSTDTGRPVLEAVEQ